MRSIIAMLLLAFLGLQYKLWLSDSNVRQWINLERKLILQGKENEQLIARNRALAADILELKSGDQALEEQARFELGMVREGEAYYQFIE